jgi:Uma2 family endonuclease
MSTGNAPILKKPTVIYPESDGLPMANNTEQFHIITTIEGNLEILHADKPQVFVAGDLFWYPVEGDNTTRMAPDVLVVFGRPKGKRGAYLQWQEENIAPQVVFEILSPGNRKREMEEKFAFYARYGVEEYYLYDPTRGRLQGWLRNEQGELAPVAAMNNWRSPRLGIRFVLDGFDLQLYYPDGSRFLTFLELSQRLEEAEKRALEALWEIDEAEVRADQAEARADQAEARAEQAEARAEQAEQQRLAEAAARAEAEARLKEMEARLRAAGLL